MWDRGPKKDLDKTQDFIFSPMKLKDYDKTQDFISNKNLFNLFAVLSGSALSKKAAGFRLQSETLIYSTQEKIGFDFE